MPPKREPIDKAFASRLVEVMRARGHISTGNRSGVDVNALAGIAGSTYEMARRYVEGMAMPRAEKVERIARWLNVSKEELLYGQAEHGQQRRLIHTEVLQSCLAAANQAEQLSGRHLSAEQMAKLVALLYEEAVDGREVGEGLIRRLMRLL